MAVTIVLNAAIVPSFAPAQLDAGRVVAPLQTIVVCLATQAEYTPGARSITLERDGRRISVRVRFVADGTPYVELAPVVRELGGSVQFDTRSKTLAIVFPAVRVVETPQPFDPGAPQVQPSAIFTPQPPRPAPRAPATGIPQPRRTAIPAIPSWPLQPAGAQTREPLLDGR
ncbi:MAG: hypothetical protein WCE44_06635 [Candidatus Velthaea sp.]